MLSVEARYAVSKRRYLALGHQYIINILNPLSVLQITPVTSLLWPPRGKHDAYKVTIANAELMQFMTPSHNAELVGQGDIPLVLNFHNLHRIKSNRIPLTMQLCDFKMLLFFK